MDAHPNLLRVQAVWDDICAGDLTRAGEPAAADVTVLHGRGAGPFVGPGRGADRLREIVLYFDQFFAGTFRQDGRCVYADDTCAVSVVRETGTTPDGRTFDHRALWISRLRADGLADAIWTVDLDDEAMRQFWSERVDA